MAEHASAGLDSVGRHRGGGDALARAPFTRAGARGASTTGRARGRSEARRGPGPRAHRKNHETPVPIQHRSAELRTLSPRCVPVNGSFPQFLIASVGVSSSGKETTAGDPLLGAPARIPLHANSFFAQEDFPQSTVPECRTGSLFAMPGRQPRFATGLHQSTCTLALGLRPTHLCSIAVDKETFSTPVLNHRHNARLNSRYYNQDLHPRTLRPASRRGLHSQTLAPLYMPLSMVTPNHTRQCSIGKGRTLAWAPSVFGAARFGR